MNLCMAYLHTKTVLRQHLYEVTNLDHEVTNLGDLVTNVRTLLAATQFYLLNKQLRTHTLLFVEQPRLVSAAAPSSGHHLAFYKDWY